MKHCIEHRKNLIGIYFRNLSYLMILIIITSCLIIAFSDYINTNVFAQENNLENSESSTQSNELIIAALKSALRDNNPEVRAYAITELANLNSLKNIGASQIRELLLDDSHIVRLAALNGVSRMGSFADNFTSEIIQNLSFSDENIEDVLVTLQNVSNINSAQIKQIVSILDYEDDSTRYFLFRIIESNPDVSIELIPDMLELMKNDNPEIRAFAVSILGSTGKSTYIPQISLMLNDESYLVRAKAAIALGEIGKPAKKQVKKIAELLKEENIYVKASAITSLGLMQDIPEDLQQVLVQSLKDKNKEVSNAAIKALANIGKEYPSVLDSLDSLLKDRDRIVQANSLLVYASIGEPVQIKTEHVAELLNDQDPSIRFLAIGTLCEFGDNGKRYSDKIKTLLKDKDPTVAIKAAICLIAMGETSFDLSDITKLLKSNDRQLRMAAADILIQSGDLAKPQIPKIIELLKNGDIRYRKTANYTLGKMGNYMGDQMSGVLELLKDPNPVIRASAVYTLGLMGEVASGYIEYISPLLEDSDNHVRADAAWSLGQMGPAAKTHNRAIANLLNDKSKHVKINAIDALSNIGNVNTNQAAQIALLLEDEDMEIQNAALIALGRICKNVPESKKSLIKFIKYKKNIDNLEVKSNLVAIDALSHCSDFTYEEAASIIDLLDSDRIPIRNVTRATLWEISPLDDRSVIRILGTTYTSHRLAERFQTRLLAYISANGDEKAEKLIKWIGKDAVKIPEKLDKESSIEALSTYLKYWDLTKYNSEMRNDFATRINQVISTSEWTKQDIPLLNRAEKALDAGQFVEEANFVKLKIEKIKS